MRSQFDQYLIDTNNIGVSYQRMLFDEEDETVDFEYTYMNPAFEEITGLTAAECVGRKGSESLGGFEDDNSFLLDLFSEVAATGITREYGFFSESAQRYYNIRVMSPERGFCILTIRDVTDAVNMHLLDMEELRQSERSKSMLLSNLPGLAYRCRSDRNWTMLFISQGCYELTGYKPESLLNNAVLSYNDLIHPEDREMLWQRWQKAMCDHTIFRVEYRIKNAGGQTRWVYEQGQPVFDKAGGIEAIEGLIIDISERKMKEERIEYLLKHDPLTGLFNRNQYESEKKRLEDKENFPLTVTIGDINGLKLVNEAFGTEEGDRLIVSIADILKQCCEESWILSRIGGDEFGILMPGTNAEQANEYVKRVQKSCKEYNREHGGCELNISLGFATMEDPAEYFSAIEKLAEDYLYHHKLLERGSICSAIISSIKTTMFERGNETKEHGERMAVLAREIGNRLRLTQLELDDLSLLATLHDVGKVVIDNEILMKPGGLSESEWEEMRKHPEIGYRIASASVEMSSIADGILSHHERWDGGGYPRGLKAFQIPLLARIVSVVDAYDAMTEDRVYRKAMTQESALAELKRNAGNQFDPYVVKAFSSFLQSKKS